MPECISARSVNYAKASGTADPNRSWHGDDLLAPARGAVNGVLLGLFFWSLIAMTWWAL
jgi:hypothetical protein